MRRLAAVLWVLTAGAVPAVAQPLICFGNEPSWRVDLNTPDRALMTLPDVAPVEYQGKDTRNEPLRERIWRGRAAAGGDLVVFLRETACSDGMSDDTHPVTARVSMPDGAFLAGCCRIPSRQAASTTLESGALLVFDKDPAMTLEGGTWDVTGHNNGRQAVVSPIVGTQLTVAFEKGTVTGQAGCNTFRATYSTTGDRITVGPANTTRKICGDGVMTQEREFLRALESATTWTIDAGLLHLHRADGERVLVGPRRR